jgi:hypothetical protein
MTIAHFYVTFLCSFRAGLSDTLAGLPWLNLTVELIAAQHLVPVLLLAALLAAWFEGGSRERRAVRQRALLRAMLGALLAWAVASLIGVQTRAWLQQTAIADASCWIGAPFPSIATAAGFALGAALYRADWRWGLGCLALVALWTMARVARGLCYPLDVFTGALIGVVPGWILGWAGWLESPLDSVVRFLRRMALA